MRFEWVIGAGIFLAVAISGVTMQLTRNRVIEEIPRDYSEVEAASAQIQDELSRLYYRYEERLVTLSELLHRYSRSPFSAELEAAKVVGVRTLSLLDFEGDSPTVHREIRFTGEAGSEFDGERFPALRTPGSNVEGVSVSSLEVGPDRLEMEGRDSGWVRSPGNVLYYWKRMQSGRIAVIGIDAIELRASISSWFLESKELEYRNLSGGYTRVIDPARIVIWENGAALEAGVSPRTFSATSLVGTWQIEAANPAKTAYLWNVPFLAAGLGLSFLVLCVSLLAAIALRSANRLAERRVTFVNRVSHELRTPITNILLNTDIAKEVIEEDPQDAALHLDRVRDETSRLSRLVDNVLTFSRREKEGHRLRILTINPDLVIKEVSGNFRFMFERAGIELRFDGEQDFLIKADPDAFAQILTNLFSNAEKYASSGGCLELFSEIFEGNWHLQVSDRGPGISSGAQEKIFEPFRRSGDSISEGVTGTGLGLTIARDLAREMSGDLRLVDSEEGATFELILPAVTS